MAQLVSKRSLFASTFLSLATPALAQPASDTQPATPQTPTTPAAATATTPPSGGDIVVTGTRIASPGLTSAAPLQVVTARDIQATGANIVQDVLVQNPVVYTGTSRTNSNFSTAEGGIATVNLRALGDARTLVLVDGHRFVSGVATTPIVDLNSIPTGFIDHVEIVSGGESSIYGSDAVAGVVNIIYKKHFQGLEGNAQYGQTQYGDGKSKQFNLTMGSNFDGGRGNVMIFGGYSNDGAVMAKDRRRTATDQSSLGALNGIIDDVFKVQSPVRSNYVPVGLFFGDNDPGALTGAGGSYPLPQSQKFNRQTYRYISIPVERYTLAARANYEITPALNWFLDGTFTHSHTHTQIEPTPLASFDPNGVFHDTGEMSTGTLLPNGTVFLNPLIPSYLQAIAGDDNGDGIPDLAFQRRMTDVGNRNSTANRYTYQLTTGANGNLGSDWIYELYGSYGRTQDDEISGGAINLAHMRNALSVIPGTASDPGAVLAPNGTYVICADANARAEGCSPANIFGADTLSPAAASYVGATSTFNAMANQIDAGANIQGKLGDFWGAGPIRVAAGAEYRKERSSIVYDSLTTQGGLSGNALANTAGSYHVAEAYGEVHVPIITDKPFFKNLEARAAGRVSHYSSIGTVYSYSAGGLYSPVPDVTFRGSVALATRAPNIGELYSGLQQTFPTGIQDPCEHVTATSTGEFDALCRADPNVAANIAQNGSFTLTQSDKQGISGYDGGNPNLKAEKGRTLTLGVVLNPRSIEALHDFNLTVDYTRTHITGAIVNTDRQTELNGCYNGQYPQFCQFILRRNATQGTSSVGAISYLNSFATNSGGIFESSLDAVLGYRHRFGFGTLSGSLAYTHMFSGWVKSLPNSPKNPFAGEIGTPKDKFLATLNLQKGPFNLAYRGQFLGRSYLDDQFVLQLTNADGSAVTNPHDPRARIKPYYIQDLQLSFDATPNFNLYAGVNNLLNITPPPIYSNLPGDVTGTETDASDYDAVGRRFYVGARLRFGAHPATPTPAAYVPLPPPAPETQTCVDGSVVPATATCPVAPPPPPPPAAARPERG